ncbi:kinase-like domain-containing protein [Haematococcus lacustris]
MEEGARPRVQFNVQQTGQVQGHSSPARESSFNNRSADASLSIVFSANWVRLVTPIGEGAFSRVFEGVYRNPETLDESVVAVKILKKNMLKRRSDCLRFIKEAKIMTKITNPNIAACYGIGKYDDDDPHNPGSLFIVQELIRGGNLLNKVYKQMLNRAKCVYSSQEALMWMIDVARGMTYLHAVSDVKPMIIHRDLKLENIMLSPEPGGVVAKLVDFGLHKVIDDRIKKVVKRVISEARLGSRFNQAAAAGEDAGDCCEEGDELEMALAEQRAMTQASSVRPGVGPAASSPLGASPVARLRASPLRVTSRMTIESAGPSMHAMPEEADEEELAIQAAQAEAEEARRAAAAAAEPALERVASADRAAAQAMADASNGQKPTLHRLASSQMEGQATPNVQSPSVAIMRAPPKKQSSMAKLMAKMKEIKLRVTGQQPGSTKERSTLSRHASSASDTAHGSKDGVQPSSPPALADSISTPASLNSVPQQPAPAAPAPQPSPQPALDQAAEERRQLAEKMARNHALLDRMLAQQQEQQPEVGGHSTLDQLGLVDRAAARRTRPTPRRAVTWINDVRWVTP